MHILLEKKLFFNLRDELKFVRFFALNRSVLFSAVSRVCSLYNFWNGIGFSRTSLLQ